MTVGLGTRNALEGMREAGPYIGLGFQLFAAIALFTGGGYWLDSKLGTLPALPLVGAAVSFILYLVLQMAKEAEKQSDRRKSDGSASPPASGNGASENRSSTLRGGPDFHSGHKRRASKDD